MNREIIKKAKNNSGFALFDLLVALLIAAIVSVAMFGMQLRSSKRSQEVTTRTRVSDLMTSVNELLVVNAKNEGGQIDSDFVPGGSVTTGNCGSNGNPACSGADFRQRIIYKIQEEVNNRFPVTQYDGQFVLCISSTNLPTPSFSNGGNYRLFAIWSSDKETAVGLGNCPNSFTPSGGTDASSNLLGSIIFDKDGKSNDKGASKLSAFELYSRIKN